MGVLQQIPYETESEQIKDRVRGYWSKRSESFSEHKHDELHSYKAALWTEELTRHLPPADGRTVRILDVGCGAGFFEMLLAPLGYNMTGIDLTPDMILEARQLAFYHHGTQAEFLIMDAEHPDFPNGFFDAVISRNLTWTLPHPADAYAEWYRVLKPGGVLLNYDAEYAKGFHQYDQAENCAHRKIDEKLIEECHDIYHMLSVSAFDRPAWDVTALKEIGFSSVEADLTAGDRLYHEKDQFYMPDRMFGIKAIK
ncbi:MAG: class I SAM-dependent methyltransferase [Mogibacterium sp.]|nr:class I SAM-dependent methyltransferase [Mogibacterium sp.]